MENEPVVLMIGMLRPRCWRLHKSSSKKVNIYSPAYNPLAGLKKVKTAKALVRPVNMGVAGRL